MTRGEATTLGLQLLGAVGCGAGVSAVLIAVDAEDLPALWAAGRIVGAGVVALAVARTKNDDPGDDANGRKRSR
jgi:hypothetical protein